jgi:hypothetical protein
MNEWLAFRTRARGHAFTIAVSSFKAAVPSTSRRWDAEHGYWLFDPQFIDTVSAIPDSQIGTAVSAEEDDRRHGREPVADHEVLDTPLTDKQYAGLGEVNAAMKNATLDELADAHRRWFIRHPSTDFSGHPSRTPVNSALTVHAGSLS